MYILAIPMVLDMWSFCKIVYFLVTLKLTTSKESLKIFNCNSPCYFADNSNIPPDSYKLLKVLRIAHLGHRQCKPDTEALQRRFSADVTGSECIFSTDTWQEGGEHHCSFLAVRNNVNNSFLSME